MPSIQLTSHERQIVGDIWRRQGQETESDRLLVIEKALGKPAWFTRGWCRLHFGVPGSRPKIERPAQSPEDIRRYNSRLYPYQRRATGAVMRVGMNYLSDLVLRPGMRKRLGPLCLYRGAMSPGQAHRYWNFALLMMAAEAETLADGMKLYGNEAMAQLCGPQRPLVKIHLHSFFGRLWDHPEVTDNIRRIREIARAWPMQADAS